MNKRDVAIVERMKASACNMLNAVDVMLEARPSEVSKAASELAAARRVLNRALADFQAIHSLNN